MHLAKRMKGGKLYITFTLRQDDRLGRVISARDMHRKERVIHEQASQTSAEVQERGAGARLLGIDGQGLDGISGLGRRRRNPRASTGQAIRAADPPRAPPARRRLSA